MSRALDRGPEFRKELGSVKAVDFTKSVARLAIRKIGKTMELYAMSDTLKKRITISISNSTPAAIEDG